MVSMVSTLLLHPLPLFHSSRTRLPQPTGGPCCPVCRVGWLWCRCPWDRWQGESMKKGNRGDEPFQALLASYGVQE